MDHVNDRVAEGADPIRVGTGAIEGWRRNVYSFPPIGSPDGGAFVTAVDLDLFIRAVIEGRLLSADMTSGFLTPQVTRLERDSWTERFGYGPWFRVEPDGSVLFLEKEGINVGVSAIVRHYPARDLTLVILSNLETGAWDPGQRLHDDVVAGTFD
jgi:CubicO group peptidase (beta-lactamase class C family)